MTKLEMMRRERGMTRVQLAEESGIGFRIIEAYEQSRRDINEAAYITVWRLAKALKCKPENIVNLK